ncbi:MAG TPA: mandelate racemase/muconate lactonizing enzyme family protein [Ktedonobacteraceae bacterium]|nr:mandelate racemase/muconate lactonizing enzyme family protein [Ktedonobacteraceae bacterium]
MKITDIRTAIIEANFPWNMIRVYTDTALVGLGEAYWGPGIMDVVEKLRPRLIGQDPMEVDRLWTVMMRAMSGPGSVAGATVAAISGIEIALLDLVGKKLKTPVYQLLGGKFRDRVRIYADSHSPKLNDDMDGWRVRAMEVRDRGFDAIKFDLDSVVYDLLRERANRTLPNRAIRRMVEIVRVLTETLGPEVDLALDCHWSYNVTDAIRLAQALEPFELLWLEDPIPPENADAMAQVQAATRIPICTGENLYLRHGFRPLIEKQACHIIQPDIPRCGGLLESKRIADMADVYYIPFAAHNISSPVGTVASAHVCAAIRTFTVLEYHSQDIPWWNAVVGREDDPLIKDGYLALSEASGLGIELNDDVCRQHVRRGTLYFGETVA